MALNKTVDKIRQQGAIKIYGQHSLNLGELILYIIAIILMAKKGAVNVTNKWVILALVLIFLSFILW